MNMLTFMSFTLECFCTLFSPYIYDSDFDKGLLKILNDSIQEHCTPLNFIKYNKNFEESKNPVIFVYFDYYNKVVTCFLSKEGNKKEKMTFKEAISKENCSFIVKEIVERINNWAKIPTFDIYFTIDRDCKKITFFEKDNFSDAVVLIKNSFKNNMENGAVINYFSKRYLDSYIDLKYAGPVIDEVRVLLFSILTIEYRVLCDCDFFNNIFKKSKEFIDSFEKNNLKKFLEKHKVEVTKPDDLYILSILYSVSENQNFELDTLKTSFILRIWDFLTNKKGFYYFFRGLFHNEKNKEKIKQVDCAFDSLITKNRDLPEYLTILEMYENEEKDEHSISDLYYYVVKSLKNKKISLDAEEMIYISKLFSVLVNQFDSLSHIVLGGNIDDAKKFSEISHQNFIVYQQNVYNYLDLFSKYLENLSSENADFFEDLSNKCLVKILESRKEDICVLNETINRKFYIYFRTFGIRVVGSCCQKH